MPENWLTRKLTVEQAEAEHMVSDERLGPTPIPFGFSNAEWRKLVEQKQPNDELWEFRSPPESWDNLCGRAGIVLVRDGEIVASIVTVMN